jgi:hypothetical protein
MEAPALPEVTFEKGASICTEIIKDLCRPLGVSFEDTDPDSKMPPSYQRRGTAFSYPADLVVDEDHRCFIASEEAFKELLRPMLALVARALLYSQHNTFFNFSVQLDPSFGTMTCYVGSSSALGSGSKRTVIKHHLDMSKPVRPLPLPALTHVNLFAIV